MPHSEPDGASNHRAQQFQITHRARKMRSNRPKRQPTRQARHPGNTHHTRQESKTQARRAALRNKTPPHQRKQRGRKGLAPGIAPGPIPPVKRPHATVWRQTRVRERSEVMTLHRRPVAALTTLSYTSKPTTSIQLYQVPPAGVEPATHSLRVNCSYQTELRRLHFARRSRANNMARRAQF